MQREKPTAISQCEGYCRITRETTPRLLAELRRQIEHNDRIRFVVQLGDFVQGLAGTPKLARVHCADGVKLVQDAKLGVPFLMTKGNHDITGPGAHEAFDAVLRPFIAGELAKTRTSDSSVEAGLQPRHASYTYCRGNARFVHFDGYVPESLDWLEGVLAHRTEEHLFFLLHQPVVPYTARSTWCIYASASQQSRRTRLLNLLGEHRAIVLAGHLHKHGVVARRTPRGSFVQVAAISVLPSLPVTVKNQRSGVSHYGPDLVTLEPGFAPQTEPQRREFLRSEAPWITHFHYADAPGYVLISVQGDRVSAQFFGGTHPAAWHRVRLTDLGG
jgi:hypothetical protein